MFNHPNDRHRYLGPDFALYFDLDGVGADYDDGIKRYGYDVDPALRADLNRSGSGHPLKREMYEKIKGTNFYAHLPILPGAARFWRDFSDINPIVLTAAPKFGATEDDYFLNPFWLGAAYHKRRWFEETFLPEAMWYETVGHGRMLVVRHHDRVAIPDEQFICTTSKRKQEFIQRKNHEHQVLIDDRKMNCENWRAAGGFAIQHNGNFDLTRQLLLEYLEDARPE